MELRLESVRVEKSRNFREESFGVGNLAVVLSILRSKLYSNPIRVVTQEILCNARDAHREIGTPLRPVQVTLPSELNPTLEIKDFGIGISPERMSDVFLRYGNSTKRGDDTQTGGFGLGAKSPFAYTDSFVIETITGGYKRTYVAYIDESSIGKLSRMACHKTKEPSGTTIKIPVQESDFETFRNEFLAVTKYWEPRPETGLDLEWEDVSAFSQKNSTLWLESDRIGTGYVCVLIDSIPYLLAQKDVVSHPAYCDDMDYLFNVGLCVATPCGVVSVSANRESLDLSRRNQGVLIDILRDLSTKILTQFQTQLDSCPDFISAVRFCDKNRALFGSRTGFQYKGAEIPDTLCFSLNGFESKSFFLTYGEITNSSGAIKPRFKFKRVPRDEISFLEKRNIFLVVDTNKVGPRIRHNLQEYDVVFLVHPGSEKDLEKVLKQVRKELSRYGGTPVFPVHFLSEFALPLVKKKERRLRVPPETVKVRFCSLGVNDEACKDFTALDASITPFWVYTRQNKITCKTLGFTQDIEDTNEFWNYTCKDLLKYLGVGKAVVYSVSVSVPRDQIPIPNLFDFVWNRIEKKAKNVPIEFFFWKETRSCFFSSRLAPFFLDAVTKRLPEGALKSHLEVAATASKIPAEVRNFCYKFRDFYPSCGSLRPNFVEKYFEPYPILEYLNYSRCDTYNSDYEARRNTLVDILVKHLTLGVSSCI